MARPKFRFGWKGVSSSRLPYFTTAAPASEMRCQVALQILTGHVRITEARVPSGSMSDCHQSCTGCLLTAPSGEGSHKECKG